jgi:hypothetical protein
MISFSDIYDAFIFVSSDSYGMNTAVLCKDTGQILYRSEMGGFDEIGEEELDCDTCVDIPHKNDLDLGQHLVFEFVEIHLPNEYDHVRQIFRNAAHMDGSRMFLNQRNCLRLGMNL